MPKEILVKSILNKTKKRDPWFLDDYTLNLYSSCSFNCLYCYIRGSKYGVNLAESLSVKVNALELLEKQLSLRAKKNQFGYIVLSSATDPYLQIEKDYQLTREALKLILKYRFPLHIITKSDLIERDFDILHQINDKAILISDLPIKNGVIITYSFSTLEDEVGSIFEPRATLPSARLKVLEKTIAEGFLTGVSMMPLIPFISDTGEQLDLMFSTFQQLGVDYLMPASLTLFGNSNSDSKTLMLRAIEKHYPQLKEKYTKWFSHSHEMPLYYKKAFHDKMKELSEKYNLSDRISGI